MKVLLENGVWLTKGEGDPARTTLEENAFDFLSMSDALSALTDARKYRPFENAEITDDFL